MRPKRRAREARQAARRAEHERERAEIEAQIAVSARPVGERVWQWLLDLHATGIAERLCRMLDEAETFAEVDVVGPLSPDGGDAEGGSGSCWVVLLLDQQALAFVQRDGPAWGRRTVIASADDLFAIPPGILGRLGRAVASGAAWETVVDDLQRKLREADLLASEDATPDPAAVAEELRSLRRALRHLDEAQWHDKRPP
jgi:hypothetical protein